MSWFMIDIEADGPIPGDFSMVSIGAVLVEPTLKTTFKADLKPISEKWVPEALAVSGFTREETLKFEEPDVVMSRFGLWVTSNNLTDRPKFIADNAGFDWMFVCWYFHHFCGSNPFGHSSTSLTSLWKGFDRDMRSSFKRLRQTKHDHNPLNDAIGNAEAMIEMANRGLEL